MFGVHGLLGGGAALTTGAVVSLSVLASKPGPEIYASAPRVATATADADAAAASPPQANAGIEIPRDYDGLFYVTAQLNGVPVRLLVDTGASVVVLTRADARRASVVTGERGFGESLQTANGRSTMAWASAAKVAFGDRELRHVRVAVARDGLPVSLLGQNLLSRLGAVTFDGDRLIVKPRA